MVEPSLPIDPRILGKILLIQTTLHAILDPEGMAEFVCRGLEKMPGITAVAVSIHDILRSSSPTLAARFLNSDQIGPNAPCDHPTELKEPWAGEHLSSIDIRTLHHFHGFIHLTSKDRTTFKAYQPFFESLANTIALTIENREHERILKQLNKDLSRANEGLESLVQERTHELVSTNTALMKEIAERKRAEEALRESEERFRSLVEQAGDGFELLDEEGRYVDVNSAACRQLGYSREELLRLKVMDIDPLVSREKYVAVFQSLVGQSPITFETIHRRKDGTTFPVEVTASVIQLAGASRGLSLARDVTERKRAEEEREKLQAQFLQAQKMESVGRLAGGVAHDFNNMLGVILGHAELVLSDLVPDSPLHNRLQQIQTAAYRSADLTRQLLAFARKQTIAPKVLDLNDAVAGMLKMIQRLIGEDIDLAWMPGADLWPVKMDPAQVDQILVNLCVNARDAIAGVGRVTIETEKITLDEAYCTDHTGFVTGQYVMLTVSDDGSGMGKDVLDHVFEPFFTTKGMGKGTGLGLATVYGIVRQNEGFINVYSKPGKGTTFKIYLPRFEAETIEGHSEREEGAPRGGTETVLLVEDEKMILELSKNILGFLGYTVLAARTPSEALVFAARHEGPIHLLITDVVMPEMDGKELRNKLATLRPETKILFMSGYTANTIAHHGVLDEGVQYIQKPFSIKGLADKVRQVLEQK